MTSSQEELSALYDACVTLLPLATGCFEDENKESFSAQANNSLLRAIQEHAYHNLADPQLSARKVARHFGISVRYVHKLFACAGITFNSYVTTARLENVRRDLLSPTAGNRHIAELAFRSLGKPVRITAVPVWVMKLVVTVTKIFNKHQGELLAFFTTAMTSEVIAPAAGTHRLADHFESLGSSG